MTKKRIILILLIMVWIITVFKFSNEPAVKSSNTSGKVVEKIVQFFWGNIKEEEQSLLKEKIEPIVRKLAHFTIYTILGILLMSLLNTYFLEKKRQVIISIGLGVMNATIDEIHQYFIPGRSCEISDIILDTIGVLTGILLFSLFYFICKKKKEKIERSKNGKRAIS